MTTRDSLHAIVDELDDSVLEEARAALEAVRGPDLTDAELEELRAREAECERGEVVDFRELLAELRGNPTDPAR